MEIVHKVFNLVWLESSSKGRHTSATIVNLMLDLLFLPAFPDGRQVWSQISTLSIYAMAVLTPFFVEEHRSGLFTFMRVGANNRCRG